MKETNVTRLDDTQPKRGAVNSDQANTKVCQE
jgi:hypothetical protein